MALIISQLFMDTIGSTPNCEIHYNGSPVKVGDVLSSGIELKLVSDYGYKIGETGNGNPMWYYNKSNGYIIATTNDGFKTATMLWDTNSPTTSGGGNVEITQYYVNLFTISIVDNPDETGTPPEPDPEPEPGIIFNIANAGGGIRAYIYTEGVEVDITLNENFKVLASNIASGDYDPITGGYPTSFIRIEFLEGYEILGVETLPNSDIDKVLTENFNGTRYSVALDKPTVEETFLINVNSSEIAPPENAVFVVPENIVNDERFKTYINGVEITAPTNAEIGDELKLVSSGVWEFIESNSAGVSTSYIQGEYDFETGVTPHVNFVIGETLDEVSLTIAESLTWDMTYYVSISMEQKAIDVSGTNNVYFVDNSIVKLVNKRRFVFDPTIGDNGGTLDYGSNILSLIEIPSEISETLIGLDESIYLGSNNTGVTAKAILSDVLTFDMGEITTPANNGDLRDFDRTECVLHLPYSQSIAIEPEYVIGETIKIEYIIDVYSGRTTINIYSTKVEEVITTQISTLGINIPYSSEMGEDIAANNSNISIGGDNRFKKPFIEIVRNEALLIDGIFTIPILDEDAIINHNGFIKVEEIELEIDGSYSEKESVISALQNGVIIK